MKKLLLLSVLLTVCLFGCGSGEGTSGTLTMSEITAAELTVGRYNVSATVTYVPEGGKSPVGAVINFTAVYSTTTGVSSSIPSSYTLGTSGIATYANDSVFQGNEPTNLRLTASFGGLSQTKTVTIPALP